MVWDGASALDILSRQLIGRMADSRDCTLKAVEGPPCSPSRKPPPRYISSRHRREPPCPLPLGGHLTPQNVLSPLRDFRTPSFRE
jgi:hypothetical protein